MIYKNRSGQLGKIITSFPVMIGIFLVMGLYIFLVSGASLNKPVKDSFDFSSSFSENNLLLKEIEVNGINDLLLNKYVNYQAGKLKLKDFQVSLVGLLLNEDMNNSCLYLYEGSEYPEINGDVILMRYVSDESGEKIIQSNLRLVGVDSEEKKLILGFGDINFKNFLERYNKEKFLVNYIGGGKIGRFSFSVNGEDGIRDIDLRYYFGNCLGGEK